nr:desulfoferrodoxin [Treponema sp.]
VQKKLLKPGEKPEASFMLNGEKLIAAYEMCNKHGLWKKEM